MKQWKEALIDSIIEESATTRIISLREIAAAHRIKHIKTHDVLDIEGAVRAQLPDYRSVRMNSSPLDSLFCSLTFVEKTLEFEEGV